MNLDLQLFATVGVEIYLNPNGGSGNIEHVTLTSASQTLPVAATTREGYIFKGWTTESDGTGAFIIDGASGNEIYQSYTEAGLPFDWSVGMYTFYALWESNTPETALVNWANLKRYNTDLKAHLGGYISKTELVAEYWDGSSSATNSDNIALFQRIANAYLSGKPILISCSSSIGPRFEFTDVLMQSDEHDYNTLILSNIVTQIQQDGSWTSIHRYGIAELSADMQTVTSVNSLQETVASGTIPTA